MQEKKYMFDETILMNAARALEYAAHTISGLASYINRIQERAEMLEYEMEVSQKKDGVKHD